MNASLIRRLTRLLLLVSLLLGAGAAPAQSITNPIAKLKDHILGVATLTAAQITTQGNTIQNNIRQVGTNAVALAAALDLVDTYDTTHGALFTTADTKNGFARNGAGFELEQALFDLQQGIMDETYTAANLVTYYSQLNNFKFDTATYFPGAVAQPANTNQGHAMLINATQLEAWGAPVMYETNAARRPTGCYLAPGSIAYVTVPSALVNKGYTIRVGAHYWDLSAKDTLKRLDRVSLVYPITSTKTRIANPLGGGIYIEVPYKRNNGIVTVGITNVVRSPLFRATSFHQTTAAEWLTERTNPGKWADFESDKFMMQVPRDWIYNFANAVKVMQDWDKAMDAVSDLFGLPQVRSKTVMYAQPDVLYRGTANAPGYPMSNDPYNPNTLAGGNKDHYLLTGPQDSAWTVLHELGHAHLFTKFTGEQESAVHILYVAAMNQKFGVSLSDAMGLSIGAVNTPQNVSISLNQAALTWILPPSFRAGQAMADTDMKYQHRGHGKYVEIASLFGWEALSNFWHSVNVDYMNGIDYPENSDPTDSRILRMSKAAGVDLRPLIHLWGVHPANAANLKTSIKNAGLQPSLAIYNRLKTYQSLVPTNQTQFETHYSKVDSSLPASDAAWYTAMHTDNTWTSTLANGAIAAIQDIIDLYFPNGAPIVQTNTWDIAPGTVGVGNGVIDTGTGTWNATAGNWTTNGGANNLIWAAGSDALFGTGFYTVNLGSGVVVRNLTLGAGGGSVTLKAVTDNNDLTVVPDSVWKLNDNDFNIVADQTNDTSLTMSGGGTLAVSGTGTFNTGEKPTGADWAVGGCTLAVQGALTVRGNIGSVGMFGTVILPAGSTYIHERNTPQTYANNWALSGPGQVTFDNRYGRLYNLNGLISGSAGIIVGNLGTQAGVPQYLQLANANTYTGLTTVMSGGLLKLSGGTNRINAGNSVFVDTNGSLDLNGQNQQLAEITGPGTVTNTSPGVLTIGRDITPSTSACVISGSGSVFKTGNASVTLTGANTYSGTTTISAGTLLVNGSLTNSVVTVASGATLGGSGTILGPTTIASGAFLTPGNSLGTLTLSNNLTLQGTVVMEIARDGAVLSNDRVTGIKTNTYGGTLIVTNVGSSPLQPGDSFQLFGADNKVGAFASIIYPLGYMFTNSLAEDGRITVASAPNPQPPGFPPGAISLLPDGNISLTATGVVGSAYRLWSSTNVALTPVTNTWTLLSNGTITLSPFTIIDNTATNFGQRFYQFSAP